ncbi:SDR family NAD(P)-dependent oxidoreductase [Rhodococcus sp. NCIMB 12038]|uniref:SDR family NAD(P)-dependent oxidoreductase n=1 Tax=Rhodococcus sp. NCIMB 12038 TaxID=933800 RepID=UPI001179E7C7|nr:SDR family NAD(P)-dependent oxidoreductase [Rhodococcus sp. NCIMB 12038]
MSSILGSSCRRSSSWRSMNGRPDSLFPRRPKNTGTQCLSRRSPQVPERSGNNHRRKEMSRNSMLRYDDRVAIVTGAGRGVGRAHALMLASRGCSVLVNDIATEDDSTGPAHAVVEEIVASGGRAAVNEDSVVDNAAQIVSAAADAFGRVDILINNAGTTEFGEFDTLSVESYERQIALHLMGPIELCRAAWPHLKRSGAGRILNTISAGVLGHPNMANYSAGKGGLLSFSGALAAAGTQFQINVNCIAPFAWSRLPEANADENLRAFLSKNCTPDRVAAFAAWLVHHETTVSGAAFEVGGGAAARLILARGSFVRAREDSPDAWAECGTEVSRIEGLFPLTTGGDLVNAHMTSIHSEGSFDFSDASAGGMSR